MDSGSGSLQSSSGGDEEFDSRNESISSFLNSSAFNQPLPTAAPPQQHQNQQMQQQQQLLSHHGSNNNLFDPFYNLNHITNQNQNLSQQQNNDHLLWSRNAGNHFGNSMTSQSVLNAQLTQQQQTLPAPPPPHLAADASAAGKGGADNNGHQPATAVKNPKKRTRASRRAPTTVLTTDTSNFRQMVQEFTGIPTGPFPGAGGSPYARRLDRLDLFSSGTSNLAPLYPLRPAAQKPHHLSPPPNTFIDSSATSHNILNMQNQMLSFNPNNPNPNPNPNNTSNNNHNIPSFLLAGKTPGMMINSMNSTTNNNNSNNSTNSASLPSYDELGLGHNVNAASHLWRDNSGTAAATHVSNYSAAAPEFLQHHHEKGLENVTSGGEGTVGSWICPSD